MCLLYWHKCKEAVAIFLINGLDGKLDNPLNDGDVISLFSPVGGG
ncbi:MAG TPA: hypothetical protein DEA61_05585 [Caldanaerobacter subterraneus]|uniref:Uncharacterized protein n=1 Tax=Caldanaerobacter subterraneus TaxID=911092 RepID=A0A357VM52_9THEO|nr:MoaD/ThiS family protein [Caldanaerobacter subterraneus]HBT49286.1 hypothetical protein [Caldanaerobacter subterraneus]